MTFGDKGKMVVPCFGSLTRFQITTAQPSVLQQALERWGSKGHFGDGLVLKKGGGGIKVPGVGVEGSSENESVQEPFLRRPDLVCWYWGTWAWLPPRELSRGGGGKTV